MKGKKNIYLHLGFWLFLFILDAFSILTYENAREVKEVIYQQIMFYAVWMVVFYIYYFYIIQLLLNKRILLFCLGFFSFLLIYNYLVELAYRPILFRLIPKPKNFSDLRFYFSLLSYNFVYALWGTMFRFTIDWLKTRQMQKELEKQSAARELALLRSQVNPQFLFSSLENIKSYVFDDPDKTSFGIIKLSELMRYMLYDASREKVSLVEEITYINNYIDLQKINIADKDNITIDVKGETANLMIEPVLMTPFIENAFRHTNLQSPGAHIRINITIDRSKMIFEVCNSFTSTETFSRDKWKNGLKSIHSRLVLLYGHNFNLEISIVQNEFRVRLKLLKLTVK